MTEHTGNRGQYRVKLHIDKTVLKGARLSATAISMSCPHGSNPILQYIHRKQVRFGKQPPQLLHAVGKSVLANRIHQQRQIKSLPNIALQMTVRFSSHPAAPVPFHGAAEFTRKSERYPVMPHSIFQYKQFCAKTGANPALFKYRSDFSAFSQPAIPPEPQIPFISSCF
jgi:hypothetical protein